VSNGSLEFWNLGFQPGAAVQNVIRWGRGRFNAQLAALATSGRATVINEPHVTCHNNEMGEVSFVTTIPYYTSTSEYNQFGQRIRGETEWEEVDVENSLFVMPRINADDTVTMSLSPMLSDQVGEVVGPDGSSYPIITEQEVYTSVTVQDGESIVMGGLIRKDDSVTHQETPLLSKLPVIGKLFRSKSYKTSNSELLIFVTPKIVRDVPAQ
ncbi:MAG: type II secretion system protein GspD, partial [Armatimonadota bacterium]